MICFVLLRLVLKMADLLQIFKKHKDLRLVKLLKLAKLAKLRSSLGSLSFHLLLKLLRMAKLLKVVHLLAFWCLGIEAEGRALACRICSESRDGSC